MIAVGAAQPRKLQDSLDIMIGQMICVGIGDLKELRGEEPLITSLLAQKVGGVVLYEKNLSSHKTAARLRRLVSTLQLSATTPLWIAIDEEGGKINRLRPKYGFVKTYSAAELARKGPIQTARQSERIAKQLHDLGINLNFAPVVDLSLNLRNSVIVKAERSFGSDPDQVTTHATAFIKAHQQVGITTVLKHFPGHGSSYEDTHIGTADVTDQWKMEELIPYQKLIEQKSVHAIMSAHIVNGRLDPEKHPATLSKPIVSKLLRGVLGYKGVVFSDDLHMQAIIKHYTLEEAIFRAIDAGVDVLLFSQNLPRDQQQSPAELHALVRKLVRSGRITSARIATSYRRIMSLKRVIMR